MLLKNLFKQCLPVFSRTFVQNASRSCSSFATRFNESEPLPFDPTQEYTNLSSAQVDISRLSKIENDGRIPAVMLSCGSFSPPTVLHCRIFEAAKNHFADSDKFQIIGGFVSPVHDAYGKKDLASVQHRIAMCQAAFASSEWITVDSWESQQQGWTRTRVVINRFEEQLKKQLGVERIKVLFLCGSDLLDSFLTPGVWIPKDLDYILGSGVVCLHRPPAEPEKTIFESDLLYRFKKNIHIVRAGEDNNVSSTLVRRLLRRNLSIKYLVDDKVLAYIRDNKLYSASS